LKEHELMNANDCLRLGVPLGEATRRATDFVAKFILGGGNKSRLREEVAAIIANPASFVDDALRSEFAKALLKATCPPQDRVHRLYWLAGNFKVWLAVLLS
jgi:hypothetical protein